MFILNLPPWLNMTLVVVLSVLVFVPIKYIYPSRRHARGDDGISRHVGLRQRRLARPAPNAQPLADHSLAAYVAYYIGLSLYATWQTAPSR